MAGLSLRPLLVLLPGLMRNARLFAHQVAAFGRDYEIIIPELTGAADMPGLAHQVLQQVRNRSCDAGPFDLAGLSMGGIAMEIVARAPARVRRLALLDTNHLADAQGRAPVWDYQIAAVRKGGLCAVTVGDMKPRYLAEASRRDQGLLERLVEMAMALGPEVSVIPANLCFDFISPRQPRQ